MVRASYTWSKAIDTASDIATTNQNLAREILPLDERNWGLNRGPGDFDIRHMLNVAWTYELPRGWSLQGIWTANSGRPYTLYAGVDTPWGNNNNRIGTVVRNGGSERRALDLAAGVTKAQLTPGRGIFGTIGRNTERGDSLLTGNVSAFKTFAITERWKLQIRAESFNISNTVNYAAPDGVLSSANFGQALAADDSRQHQLVLRLTF